MEIERAVRAFQPWPGLELPFGAESVKVLEAKDGKAESGDPVDAPSSSSGASNTPAEGAAKPNGPASGSQGQ